MAITRGGKLVAELETPGMTLTTEDHGLRALLARFRHDGIAAFVGGRADEDGASDRAVAVPLGEESLGLLACELRDAGYEMTEGARSR